MSPNPPSCSDLPAPAPSTVTPRLVRSFRDELVEGRDVIDPVTFAGTIPQDRGIAPRVRVGSKWFNLLWLLPIGFVLLIVAVAVAKGVRELPGVQSFMRQYPGMSELPADAPLGFPACAGPFLPGTGSGCWLGAANAVELFVVAAAETVVGCTGETAGAFTPSCTPVMTAAPMTVTDKARWSHDHTRDSSLDWDRAVLRIICAGAAVFTAGPCRPRPGTCFP